MVKTIIVFFIILFVFSAAGAIFPIFVRDTSIFDVVRHHFGYGSTMKKWEQQSYLRRFIGIFLVGTIIGLISFGIGHYQDIQNPTGFEQMLLDGEAEYLAVFGDEYIGDADNAFEIKKGHSRDDICEIISDICNEDYIKKGGKFLNVSTEGENYIIMNAAEKIGKVTMVERKFGVVLRFYWN